LFVQYLPKTYCFFDEAPDAFIEVNDLSRVFNDIHHKWRNDNYNSNVSSYCQFPMAQSAMTDSINSKKYNVQPLVRCLQRLIRLFPKDRHKLDYLNIIQCKDIQSLQLCLDYGLDPQKYFAKIISMDWVEGYTLALQYGAIFDVEASTEYCQQLHANIKRATIYYDSLFKINPKIEQVYVPQNGDINDNLRFVSLCRTGYLNVIKHFLIDHREHYSIDINIRDLVGNTCLYYASPSNNFQLVRLLIENGADTRLVNHSGQSMWSILCNNESFQEHRMLSFYLEEIIVSDKSLFFHCIPTDVLSYLLNFYRYNAN
jgi:hypothetical protein